MSGKIVEPQPGQNASVNVPRDVCAWVAPADLIAWVREELAAMSESHGNASSVLADPMLPVLAYAYARGILDADEIAQLCRSDPLFRELAKGAAVSSSVLKSFRHRDRGLLVKLTLPGDEHVAMLHRVIIDARSGAAVRLRMDPDYHRATLGDDFSLDDMTWSPDASKLAFVSTSRDHKSAVLRVADAVTGDVRTVFDETVATHYESVAGWRVLWAANEVIWYSQRDDWGHLYLYDLATGKLKHQITSGEGPVSQIVRVDEKARLLHFIGLGREKGQDPYFRHAYRVGLDGKGSVSLTPDDGDHDVQLSPSGKYLIDTYSTCEKPPVVVLRDASTGKVIMPLVTGDGAVAVDFAAMVHGDQHCSDLQQCVGLGIEAGGLHIDHDWQEAAKAICNAFRCIGL